MVTVLKQKINSMILNELFTCKLDTPWIRKKNELIINKEKKY